MSTEERWGIYDVVDRCWLGNEAGPLVYVATEIKGTPFTGQKLAQVAAFIVSGRMKMPGRIKARPMEEGVTVLKDVITPPLSSVQAMKRAGI